MRIVITASGPFAAGRTGRTPGLKIVSLDDCWRAWLAKWDRANWGLVGVMVFLWLVGMVGGFCGVWFWVLVYAWNNAYVYGSMKQHKK